MLDFPLGTFVFEKYSTVKNLQTTHSLKEALILCNFTFNEH